MPRLENQNMASPTPKQNHSMETTAKEWMPGCCALDTNSESTATAQVVSQTGY